MGWHSPPRTAQHGAPPRREQLHGRVTRHGPNHHPKPGTNTNRKQHSIPGHSTSRRADWHTAPHSDSSIRGSPDLRIGRAAVGPQRATRSPACPKVRRPHEATRRGRRRQSMSAQSTERGRSACPGSLFPGDGCLPRQGRFVSAQVTLRSPGGGGGHTAPKPNVAPFGTRPDRRAREARRRVATTTMKLQRTDHNVSRCKYKFNWLD